MLDLALLLAAVEPAAAAAPGPLLSWENAIALLTLTALEIVLGIDNIVFIAILAAKLPPEQQRPARRLGLTLALVTRIALLLTIAWIVGLAKTTLFVLPVLEHAVSGRDLVLILGGLFLIGKATHEIHGKVEGDGAAHATTPRTATFRGVIAQILLIDLVFSLDSVITAVGMARAIPVMVAAVIIAVGVMLVFAEVVSGFIERHPTVKMLALAFLLLIGVVLVADGLGRHIEKGYIYFAMAFSLGVELLNLAARRRRAAHAPAGAH